MRRGVALARPCCLSGGEWHGYMPSNITLAVTLFYYVFLAVVYDLDVKAL